MSSILAIPLVRLEIETGTNEDWIDSFKYIVDTGVDLDEMPQLDLRGITFDMEIRRAAEDAEVVLAASTKYGTLQIGAPPNFGFLIINIPLVEMSQQIARQYVGDIVGHDEFYSRVVARIDLTILEGVTKQPVNTRIVVAA